MKSLLFQWFENNSACADMTREYALYMKRLANARTMRGESMHINPT